MTTSLILACLWAIASAIVAMLPMRRQYAPGICLLVAAPLLIIFMGYQHGWWVAAFGLFAFVSMFRNPLRYLYRRMRGLHVEVPE
ncbi:DUF2484 family protein [Alphaproteobacteria bacterium KMM 3653]|uniref:DUF2484 family protein n=1 Tax=Harenicola maris TaxID=2841044 RepID=A0AAP2CPQ4_9RHOB|nr:DUF2484 family protein [Harenicola maris]